MRYHGDAAASRRPGARIDALVPRGADPNLRRVVVDGAAVATLRAADVEALGLAPGMAWTPALDARVRSAVESGRARALALSALSRRSLSRGELEERLERRGYSGVARSVVAQIAADGWLDDDACARERCREILRRGPAGPARLAHELARRRIAPEVARRAIAEALEGADPREAALLLARATVKRAARLGPEALARRVAATLERRGFDGETIASTLDTLRLATAAPEDL